MSHSPCLHFILRLSPHLVAMGPISMLYSITYPGRQLHKIFIHSNSRKGCIATKNDYSRTRRPESCRTTFPQNQLRSGANADQNVLPCCLVLFRRPSPGPVRYDSAALWLYTSSQPSHRNSTLLKVRSRTRRGILDSKPSRREVTESARSSSAVSKDELSYCRFSPPPTATPQLRGGRRTIYRFTHESE